jgi:hypothetical protein
MAYKTYVLTTKEGITKKAKAKNLVLASKKMNVSPYELRTFGFIEKEIPIIAGKTYHYDDEFEGERLVDDVRALETSFKAKEILVYSPKLRANILLVKGRLK